MAEAAVGAGRSRSSDLRRPRQHTTTGRKTMKFARTRLPGPDGDVARLVVVDTDGDRVVDLATAERLRLQGRGASERRAREVALTTFPGSLAAALGTGEEFLDPGGRGLPPRGAEAAAPLGRPDRLPP